MPLFLAVTAAHTIAIFKIRNENRRIRNGEWESLKVGIFKVQNNSRNLQHTCQRFFTEKLEFCRKYYACDRPTEAKVDFMLW